jgi:hypothetical protein
MMGTAKTRERAKPPERADALARIILPDQDAREVRLGDLWRDRPAVIVWLRHYG